MRDETALVFKFASEDWEFEAIHRLNYQTFVEESPNTNARPRTGWWTSSMRKTPI